MPFIGNQPALSFTSFAKQDFTTSATTSYTLDNPVANANELALFINFVRQEPVGIYSASGTTLTLTEATSSSDDMYCVYLGKAVQTVTPANNSVTSSMLASGNLTIPNGNLLFDTADKGIYLGVTSATASNLLDDYEEGTFTASFEFASTQPSAGNTTSTGYYTKIGNMVTVWCTLKDVNVTGGSGDARIRGLPFTSKTDSNITGWLGTASITLVNIASSSYINADVQDGFTYIRFIENIDDGQRDLLNVANFNHGTSDVYCCVSYQVD